MSKAPAAANVLRILNLLASTDTPMSAARIKTELGLPRSTTYYLLQELLQAGFASYLPELRSYALGPSIHQMNKAYTKHHPLVRRSIRILRDLVTEPLMCGFLNRIVDAEIVYLLQEGYDNKLPFNFPPGKRLPVLKTASGKVILSTWPKAEVVELCEHTGADYEELAPELHEIVERGYQHEDERILPGWSSIAAPVIDHTGRARAAITICYPTGSLDETGFIILANRITARARQLSRAVYGTEL